MAKHTRTRTRATAPAIPPVTRPTPRSPMKKMKLASLPKSSRGHGRKTAGLGAYEYQKEELRKRAHANGMTVSYYLNHLLWADWITVTE